MRLTLPLLLIAAGLSSCSTPPKPPQADESTRRPANAAMAVELQSCQNELQNTRLQLTESTQRGDHASAMLADQAARQQIANGFAAKSAMAASAARANLVQDIRFDFGSTRVSLPVELSSPLVDAARTAPLVVLRGRTDGTNNTLAEGRIARARAEAVRDWLVAAGVDASRIRSTWQPVGDGVADNGTTSGQRLNRRVEVEVYRALPVALAASAAAQP